MRIFPVAFLIAVFTLGCADPTPIQPTSKQAQEEKAQQAAANIRFDNNAEIDNIKRRLELTSEPGLLGYVVLLNQSGQPIQYTTVKGKITSSSKRLTKPYDFARVWCSGGSCDSQVPSGSDEGTFGSSDPYIYFWTTSGQYIQWNGAYLYSDKPFRLRVEPLVIDIADKTAE